MKIVAQVSRKALIRVSSVLACSDMASALLVHSEDEQKGMNPTRAIARRGRGVKKHRPTGRFCRGVGGEAWRPESASGVQFLPVHMTPELLPSGGSAPGSPCRPRMPRSIHMRYCWRVTLLQL
jgi:hypothetical protein